MSYYTIAVRDKESVPERLVMLNPTDDYRVATERLAALKNQQQISDPRRYRIVRIEWCEADAPAEVVT